MDTTSSVPCTVCGNTDMTLVDGYYYCVECGTQDANVQETIIEQTVLADGTIATGATKKINTLLKEGIEMSDEWHKWHTFNFILCGLVNELISLGAAPTVKMKVLWIWSRYIKLFQDKDALGLLSTSLEETHIDKCEGKFTSKSIEGNDDKGIKKKKLGKDIKYVTKSLLLAILYIALNMDKSDIQLYHLLRFVQEKRLSLLNCNKFIPEELNLKKVPDWIRFVNCRKEVNMLLVQRIGIALINKLNLGPPLVPDLRKLVNNFIDDLCLPDDFKQLILSLMKLIPCDFLDLSNSSVKRFKKLPEYEVVVMSYVIVGMKMCFGLDCEYECRLSDAVDKVNTDKYYIKSHKLGLSSNPTERLFSFREWCTFMQFRKMILCQHYLPMAIAHGIEADDFVFMEQSEERKRSKTKISDEVTMNILHKIQPTDEFQVIPKSEFPPSLTPLATYTAVIVQYYQDPELKLLLSEDFTQYSLKYACQDLFLPTGLVNIVVGVSECNKTICKEIIGSLSSKKADLSEVFVRNCDNKNWLTTNPPQPEHITKVENGSDYSDLGYDSPTDIDLNGHVNVDQTNCDKDNNIINTLETLEQENKQNSRVDKLDTFKEEENNRNEEFETLKEKEEENMEINKFAILKEEEEGKNIFDDPFDDIEDKPELEEAGQTKELFDFEPTSDINVNFLDDNNDDSISTVTNLRQMPSNFNREDTIKELIIAACRRVKAPIPAEYKPRPVRIKRPRDRRIEIDGPPVKRTRVPPLAAQIEMDLILSSYYTLMENDILTKISEHLQSVVGTLDDNLNTTRGQVEASNFTEAQAIEENGILADNFTESQVADENNYNNTMENNSVIEQSAKNDSDVSEDESLKTDPRFDEKYHDIKQLYVKINNTEDVPNIFNVEEDPDVIDIIERKIDELGKEGSICSEKEIEKHEETQIETESESEDEIPLSVIKTKIDENKIVLDNLVTNEEITEFNYWVRHYTSGAFSKNVRMSKKFDIELQMNFPKSFVFVMQECASVLGCSTFSLYKAVQNLEQSLVIKSKSDVKY